MPTIAMMLSGTPPTPPGVDFWRFRSTATWTGGPLGIATMEMREVGGGTDYALGATATASFNIGAPFTPSAGVDGNNATFWTSGGSTMSGQNWLIVDLGAPRAITEVKITVRPDAFREDPRAFVIESSSDAGSSWDNLDWVSLIQPVWTAGETRTFTRPDVTSPRWFRLRTTATWASGFLGIATMEARETGGGTDFARASNGGLAAGSFELGGFPASNAIDNNGSTFWTTGGSTLSGENWLMLEFADGHDITEVKLTVRPDGFREDPKDFVFESSVDGTTWDSLSWTYTAEAAWSAGETRTFTKP